MSRKRIKPIIDTISGYTEKQTKYIRDEINVLRLMVNFIDIKVKFIYLF